MSEPCSSRSSAYLTVIDVVVLIKFCIAKTSRRDKQIEAGNQSVKSMWSPRMLYRPISPKMVSTPGKVVSNGNQIYCSWSKDPLTKVIKQKFFDIGYEGLSVHIVCFKGRKYALDIAIAGTIQPVSAAWSGVAHMNAGCLQIMYAYVVREYISESEAWRPISCGIGPRNFRACKRIGAHTYWEDISSQWSPQWSKLSPPALQYWVISRVLLC